MLMAISLKAQTLSITTLLIIAVFLIQEQFVNTLGTIIYAPPPSNQFAVFSVSTYLYMGSNSTIPITYSTAMKAQPSVVISFRQLYINYTMNGNIGYEEWFYVFQNNTSTTGLQIVANTKLYQYSITPIQYFSLNVLVSALGESYVHIDDFDYTGPRLNATQNKFWNNYTWFPTVFGTCFTDSAQTIRTNIYVIQSFRGYVGSNFNYNDYAIVNGSQYIWNSSKLYQMQFVVDHTNDNINGWIDQVHMTFMFYCPNSYSLNKLYATDMYSFYWGNIFQCNPSPDSQNYTISSNVQYSTSFVSIKNIYRGMSFDLLAGQQSYMTNLSVAPIANNSLTMNFITNVKCGAYVVDYFVLSKKGCQNYYSFNLTSISCYCDNSRYFYENGTDTCQLICPTGMTNLNHVCINCNATFGSQCTTCSNTTCSNCLYNYSIVGGNCVCSSPNIVYTNGSCTSCTTLYGAQCSSCNTTSCVTCSSNYSIVSGNCTCSSPNIVYTNGSCTSCTTLYGAQCLTCNNASCLTCSSNYSIVSGNCTCSSPNIVYTNGSCTSCTTLYGAQCLTCNNASCLTCSSNYPIISGNCKCISPNFISSTSICQSCLTQYDPKCISCNVNSCLSCSNNYIVQLNSTTCSCPSNSVVLNTTNLCTSCGSLFGFSCNNCSQTQCFQCSYDYNLINGTCTCSNDRFLFSNRCLICNQIWGWGCYTCNFTQCLSCYPQWTHHYDNTCACQLPNQLMTANGSLIGQQICVNCQSLYGFQACNLIILSTYVQIGRSFYIQIYFNHPYQEVVQIISLYRNIQFSQGNNTLTQIQYLSIMPPIYKVHLPYQQTYVNVKILNPNYLKWNHLILSNQLDPIKVDFSFNIDDSFTFYVASMIIRIIVTLCPLLLFFSFGTLNTGFQVFFLASFYIYLNNPMTDLTTNILNQMNISNIWQVFSPYIIPNLHLSLSSVDFKLKVFSMNKDIIYLTSQPFFFFILSFCLIIYLREYMKNKRNFDKYIIYINYLKHYKQYSFSNVLSLYPYLSFVIGIQVQSLMNTNWDISDSIVFTNTVVTAFITVLYVFMPIFVFGAFPVQNQEYSIIYDKSDPNKMLVALEYLFKYFKFPVFIYFILIFPYQEIKIFALVGLTIIHVIIHFLNYGNSMAKLYWLIKLIKQTVFLAFQICYTYQFYSFDNNTQQNRQGSMGYTTSFLLISTISIQVLQAILKMLRIALVNKYGWQDIKSNQIMPNDQFNMGQQQIPSQSNKKI